MASATMMADVDGRSNRRRRRWRISQECRGSIAIYAVDSVAADGEMMARARGADGLMARDKIAVAFSAAIVCRHLRAGRALSSTS